MAEKPARILIGYALSSKKVDSFIRPSLLKHAAERGIDLIPVELSKPLIDQGPFHCIIHKVSTPEWIDQLRNLVSQQSNVVIIDDPAATQRLHNRVTMLEVVNQLVVPLSIPKQVFVKSPDSALEHVINEGIGFPLIAKPLVSDGSVGSHQMALVFDEQGLKSLNLDPPFVLQEFVNHGGVIFKVYVASRYVQCVKRISLPDIPNGGLAASENSLSFSQISNAAAHDHNDDSIKKLVETVEMPEPIFVNEVASQLRKALNLNLFNFDMIRDSRCLDRYLVIDINYFPGYAKMSDFERILTDFFLDVVSFPESC